MSPLSLPRLEAPGIRHFSDPKATSVYLRLCNFSINDKGVFGHSCIGSVSLVVFLSLSVSVDTGKIYYMSSPVSWTPIQQTFIKASTGDTEEKLSWKLTQYICKM